MYGTREQTGGELCQKKLNGRVIINREQGHSILKRSGAIVLLPVCHVRLD